MNLNEFHVQKVEEHKKTNTDLCNMSVCVHLRSADTVHRKRFTVKEKVYRTKFDKRAIFSCTISELNQSKKSTERKRWLVRSTLREKLNSTLEAESR